VNEPPLIVKVGGSLLSGPDAYARIAAALAPALRERNLVIVVSAAKGVTDQLEAVAAGEDASSLVRRHEALFQGRVPADLMALLHSAVAQCPRNPAPLMAWGERASAAVLAMHLRRQGMDVPVIELSPDAPAPKVRCALVPGFFTVAQDGHVQVLPRGGSDISAVMAAKWWNAHEVHLWKDGGGIRLEPGITAKHVDAAELVAWLGDRVRPVHPEAVRMAANCGIGLTLLDPWGLDGATRIGAALPASPRIVAAGAASP
jgi:aspartokinase